MKKLKLFVWEGVLNGWTPGIAFALASNVDEARQVICPRWTPEKNDILALDLRNEPKVYESPVGFSVWGGD